MVVPDVLQDFFQGEGFGIDIGIGLLGAVELPVDQVGWDLTLVEGLGDV